MDLRLAVADRPFSGEANADTSKERDLLRGEESTLERLGRLFDSHHRRLYVLARRLASDPEEARDLVQETFLRAARHSRSIPEGEPAAGAWLVRVLVNLCRDRWRRLAVKRRAAVDPAQVAGMHENPETAAIARATVEAALARLSPRRRAVIVLHELEGLSTGEVAMTLGIGQVTVRWHLAAARRDLKRFLLGPGREPTSGRRAGDERGGEHGDECGGERGGEHGGEHGDEHGDLHRDEHGDPHRDLHGDER